MGCVRVCAESGREMAVVKGFVVVGWWLVLVFVSMD